MVFIMKKLARIFKEQDWQELRDDLGDLPTHKKEEVQRGQGHITCQ